MTGERLGRYQTTWTCRERERGERENGPCVMFTWCMYCSVGWVNVSFTGPAMAIVELGSGLRTISEFSKGLTL